MNRHLLLICCTAPLIRAGAAPREVDARNSAKSPTMRMVSGPSGQIDEAVAGGATAVLSLTPVSPKTIPASDYPPGSSISGQELTLGSVPARVWVEITVTNWAPRILQVGQVRIDGTDNEMNGGGYQGANADCDGAPPVPPGGDLSPAMQACPGQTAAGHAICTTAFAGLPCAQGAPSRCLPAADFPYFPQVGFYCEPGFQDQCDPEWILSGIDGVQVVSTGVINYRYGFTAVGGDPPDFAPSYMGTLVLDVPANAKGTYTIDFGLTETFLQDPGFFPDNDIPLAAANVAFITVAGSCFCFANEDCDDGDGCTQDVCTKGVGCSNPPNATWDQETECCDAATGVETALGCADPCEDAVCSEGGNRGTAQCNPSNGVECDDGNLCTSGDTCVEGVCTPKSTVECTAPDDCNDPGICDPLTGKCPAAQPRPDGTPCDDENACTQEDSCVQGECVPGDPLVCTNGGPCQDPGACDPLTGLCSKPVPRPDGAECDDEDACTVGDRCVEGACTALSTMECSAPNQCYDAGTCDPLTGKCPAAQPRPDGTPCDDENACTQEDSCVQGECVPGDPLVCTNGGPCQDPGACDPLTGLCSEPVPLPDGAECDDEDACTVGDHCVEGACVAGSFPALTLSDPPDGAIDARIPLTFDGSTILGFQEITLGFEAAPLCTFAEAFTVSQMGGALPPPLVIDVVIVDQDRLRVVLDRPIEPLAWTTLRYLPTGASVRIGFLPGDVNADGRTAPADILELVDVLIGNGPFRPKWSTDIDRSGETNPADILTLVDILNGANPFDAYNGATLP